jgi:hypothetical protein
LKRFHSEIRLMLKRKELEYWNHYNYTFGRLEGQCACLNGTGWFRKKRPLDKCGRGRCGSCDMWYIVRQRERRRDRYTKRKAIIDDLLNQ